MIIKKAQRSERYTLILNSYNKMKTIRGIINKESGRNKKKRGEIRTLKVEGRKITDQQIIAETFNEHFVAITENIKRQSKNNLVIDKYDNNSIDNPTHFMEQTFN
jgi:hypothetical protein